MHFEQQEGRYGPAGSEMWRDATRLLNNLLAPKPDLAFMPGDPPQWDEGDIAAFANYHAFERSVPFLEPQSSVGGDSLVDGQDLGDLFRNFRELNACLPFSEGERHWLLAQALEVRAYQDYGAFVTGLIPVETPVISDGIQQKLVGEDLARRWPAWRREQQEFSGQGSLQKAQRLLGRIIYELVPGPYEFDEYKTRKIPYAAEFLVPDP